MNPARVTVPISGSAVRADPIASWEYIPRPVRPDFVRRVALLGPESMGKTTLAQRLARHFSTTWVPQYGRPYCDERPALTLEPVDFEAIAWGQATREDERALDANGVLFCDTELHTTATWSDMIVGTRPAWLTAAARARELVSQLLG